MRQEVLTLFRISFLYPKCGNALRVVDTLSAFFLFAHVQKGGQQAMKKGNRRLKYEDRKKIEEMERNGEKVVAIADAIGVHRATIYNELKRGGVPYRAEVAQKTI